MIEISDKKMLDWFDKKTMPGNRIAFYWSSTDRGWRIMEFKNNSNFIFTGDTIREAVFKAMRTEHDEFHGEHLFLNKVSDKEILDWLQEKLGNYTGKCMWRMSSLGTGWIFHETSRPDAVTNVRTAIKKAMKKEMLNLNSPNYRYKFIRRNNE